MIEERSSRAGETVPAIYFFTSAVAVGNALDNWLGDETDGVELCLLEVAVPAHWVCATPGIEWEASIFCHVPPDHIRVLIPDVDHWTGAYPGGPPPEWAE